MFAEPKKEHKFQFIKPTNPKQGLKEGQVVSKGTQIQYKVKIKAYIKMIDHEENYKFWFNVLWQQFSMAMYQKLKKSQNICYHQTKTSSGWCNNQSNIINTDATSSLWWLSSEQRNMHATLIKALWMTQSSYINSPLYVQFLNNKEGHSFSLVYLGSNRMYWCDWWY